VTRRGFLSKQILPPQRDGLILAGLALLALLIIAAFLAFQQGRETAETPKIPKIPETIRSSPAPVEPGFDVIRVTRDGHGVMAGRAAPGASVTVKSGDLVIGETRADKHGDWVMIPQTPLKPGAQVLTLSAQSGADGPVLSRDSAVISVPARPDGEVFVAVSRPGKATRILDQGLPDATPDGVAVAVIDLDPQGGASLSGRAAPGQLVRLYLDNQPAGETLADEKGDWEHAFNGHIPPGQHLLRADQLDQEGKVALRAEVSFSRAEEGRLQMGAQQVMVMQGNALWEIARRIYGSGIAYSVIFTRNRQQIRDPDKIYPGQIFDIPSKPSEPAAPIEQPPAGNTIP